MNDNLIFTSSSAVRSVIESGSAERLKSKPAYCVGLKTAKLLGENGFSVLEVADHADALATIIISKYRLSTFTFFTGNLTMDTLPELLKVNNIHFNEVEVYETQLVPHQIKSNADGILFFSPSAVESFLITNELKDQACFCIGSTTAKALQKVTSKIIIANSPSVENTIIQAINYFKK